MLTEKVLGGVPTGYAGSPQEDIPKHEPTCWARYSVPFIRVRAAGEIVAQEVEADQIVVRSGHTIQRHSQGQKDMAPRGD